jgi:hypothetical protein
VPGLLSRRRLPWPALPTCSRTVSLAPVPAPLVSAAPSLVSAERDPSTVRQTPYYGFNLVLILNTYVCPSQQVAVLARRQVMVVTQMTPRRQVVVLMLWPVLPTCSRTVSSAPVPAPLVSAAPSLVSAERDPSTVRQTPHCGCNLVLISNTYVYVLHNRWRLW